MKELLERYQPKPIDEAAKEALNDSEYAQRLEQYGREVVEITEPTWQKEYLGKQ